MRSVDQEATRAAALDSAVKDFCSRIRENSDDSPLAPKSHDFGYVRPAWTTSPTSASKSMRINFAASP